MHSGRPHSVIGPILAVVRIFALGVACGGVGVGSVVARAADVDRLAADRLEDAELTAVTFLDADRGWAVGDRGAIWQTTDGGRSWRLQPAACECRWEDIVFVDERNGWVAGGWVEPGTHKTRAVLLRTRDGGQNWMQLAAPTLPGLRRIAFQDERHGWAIATASSMYPTGLLETQDGGRSWNPLPGQVGDAWLAGDFLVRTRAAGRTNRDAVESPLPSQRRARLGIAAGGSGRLALVTPTELLETALPTTPIRAVRQVRLSDSGQGWLVGDNGLVLQTSDGGLQWRAPAGELPAWLAECDLTALAVHGPNCWIAGAPGSWVLHSADQGATWAVQSTGQGLPLKSLHFVDPQHGWGVGALGAIVATRDGGHTWRRQHGGQRLAVLAIVDQSSHVPLELLAQLCGNDGYRGGAVVLFRRDLEAGDSVESRGEQRLHAAVVAAGGSVGIRAGQFPVRQRGLGLSAEQYQAAWTSWNSAAPGPTLERFLVTQIRQWRPDVLVTVDPEAADDQPLARIAQDSVLAACAHAAAAADDTSIPGLSAWQVKKVLAALPGSDRGAIRLSPASLAPRLGRTLADAVVLSQDLAEVDGPSLEQHSFRVLASHLPQDSGRRDIFGGLTIPPGSEARRAASGLGKADLAALQRSAQQQRNVHQLLLRSSGVTRGGAWLAQFDDLTRQLNSESACEVAWQLARRCEDSSQHEMAAAALALIIERYADQPWCDAALVKLARYQTSGELAYWLSQQATESESVRAADAASAAAAVAPPPPGVVARPKPAGLPSTSSLPLFVEMPTPAPIRRPSRVAAAAALAANEEAAPAVALGERIAATDRLAQAGAATDPAEAATERTNEPTTTSSRRDASAAKLAEWLERNRPWLFAEPAIKLALAGPTARQGRGQDVRQWLRLIGAPSRTDSWSQIARQELARLDIQELPKATAQSVEQRVMYCRAVDRPPQLDGRLDEAMWSEARPVALHSALSDDQDWPAVVLLAHDAEHLYLGVHCRKAQGVDYPKSPGPRPRDPDLAARDRVTLYLDVDRDYQTAFELTIDSRGWVGERCAGDARWNPHWFVAARDDAEAWTVEAAIAWRELVAEPPVGGSCWACGVQRVVPGVGFQSWTKPATVTGRTDGWGLLSIE